MSKFQVALLALCAILALITLTIGFYAFYAISDLRSSNEALLQDYKNLAQQYKNLLSLSRELESKYQELRSSYAKMRWENERLSNESIQLREALEGLEGKISILEKNLSKIGEQYQNLSSNYRFLNRSYFSIRKDYERLSFLVGSVSKRVIIKPEVIPEMLKEFLSESSKLEPLVFEDLGLSKEDQPAIKAEKLLTWIMVNLQYLPDDFHEVVVDDDIWPIMDHASSPLETLSRKGGDCEDLAIFSYAALTLVSEDGESPYLIGLKGTSPFAHMAVLYKVNEGYIIVDPAGLYATDVSYALEVIFEKQKGEGRESVMMYLDPLILNPQLKHQLMDMGLAKLIPVSSSFIKPEPSEDAVNQWVKKWEKQVPLAYVNFIANSTFYKTFNSTQEFLDFVELGGLS